MQPGFWPSLNPFRPWVGPSISGCGRQNNIAHLPEISSSYAPDLHIPRTCEYVPLRGKRDLTDVISKGSGERAHFLGYPDEAKVITGVLYGGGRRVSQRSYDNKSIGLREIRRCCAASVEEGG